MTSKKNLTTNRTPRRIDRSAGGRSKGVIAPMLKKYFAPKNEDEYNRLKKKYEVKN